MSGRLEWHISEAASLTLVSLKGPINEDADLEPLAGALRDLFRDSRAKPTRLRLELSGISRINSCGVREWVNFIRSLPPECAVELDRCPPSVVAQLNMISNFAGSARILSVQAPYVCEACGNEENVLVAVTPGVSPEIGAMRCRSCGGEMEFDDIQDSYFAFLT